MGEPKPMGSIVWTDLTVENGIVDGPRGMSGESFCVIRDPAGAVLALVGPR